MSNSSTYRLFPIISTSHLGCATLETEGSAVEEQLITTSKGVVIIDTRRYAMLKGSSIAIDSYLLQFDGLSEPNPGASSGGAVLYDPSGKVVFEAGQFISFATNNQAEYSGLILGLQTIAAQAPSGGTNLRIEGDSQLIINQVAGQWKVKNDALKTLHASVHEALANPVFGNVGIKHVYRENNKHADKLTNDVMKTRTSFLRMT